MIQGWVKSGMDQFADDLYRMTKALRFISTNPTPDVLEVLKSLPTHAMPAGAWATKVHQICRKRDLRFDGAESLIELRTLVALVKQCKSRNPWEKITRDRVGSQSGDTAHKEPLKYVTRRATGFDDEVLPYIAKINRESGVVRFGLDGP